MRRYLPFIVCVFISAFTIAQKNPSHQQWDKLLRKNVNIEGLVNYKGFQKDKAELTAYLKILSDNPAQNTWSENEQKAYWINAYNAFTISLILQHYPLKSIKAISSIISIPFINSPWDIKFINIGGKKYDLNNIEHDILRKKYNDPRIHFAIVCASLSCPRLRNEAYTATQLNTQLDNAGIDFLNDKTKNNLDAGRAELSKYFSWYKGDFIKNNTLAGFINKYARTKINESTRISYLDYNWSLNEQK